MKRSVIVLGLCFFSFISSIQGQDPHFSQYFSSPLTLNPSMAGYFKGDYRFSTNFRQQWASVGTPYTTGTFSYDTKLLQQRVAKNDIFSLGLLGLFDQSLAGGYKSVNASASLAYHKGLDAEGVNSIAAGFQFTYASRSINVSALDFATQFTGSGFNNNLPSFESIGNTGRNYIDINTGVLYTHKAENMEVYLGASLYHIGTPNTSFLKNEKFDLPMRYTVHGGSRFVVGQAGHELFIGGLYMEQAGASEKTVGIAYGIGVNDETKVYAGSWYRIGDAIIPYVGLSYGKLQFGVTYDINNSTLKDYSTKARSLELSLNLLITKPRNVYTNYKGGRVF
jgi:type IX secretion system PorP/SprF family membrane protein